MTVMKSSKTDPEELAEVIFNSQDADLNDLLCEIVSTSKFDIGQMLREISATVNNSLSLHSSSSICEPSQRLVFLKEEIRAELIYYIFYAKRRVRLQTRQERA